jgi:hypothetical protein
VALSKVAVGKGRRALPTDTRLAILTEAGYRCAVPTCRTILAIDLHHIEEVSEGGPDEMANLIALCPTCHALFHRGTIARESLYAWKAMLVALSHAFDAATIDDLLFLDAVRERKQELDISGDGVLRFSRLIGSGLAEFHVKIRSGTLLLYRVTLTPKGQQLVAAWKAGNRVELGRALGLAGNEAAE